MSKIFLLLFTAFLIGFSSCKKDKELMALKLYSGGRNGTIFDKSKNAFMRQMPGISDEKEFLFFVGNSFFNLNWVPSPATAKARDGLGPLMGAKSCSACHFKDGKGTPFIENGDFSSGFLIRLSVPGTDAHGGPLDEPTYGGQFSDLVIQGIQGLKSEGDIEVSFSYINGTFSDGESYTLRKPTYTTTNLNYGAMSASTMTSPRVGPHMIGLGLLEAIGEEGVQMYIDEGDSNNDGISGRANYVWDIMAQTNKIGKFGWKANKPSLLQQVAGAFNGDLGIKTFLFPNENHTSNQSSLDTLADGGQFEIDDDDLLKTVLYSATLAVPARRNVEDETNLKGEELFESIDCAKCHITTFKTGTTHEFSFLHNQTIHPYTDLLIHDMGEGLSDNRPDYMANGNEWRTAPLWGIGLIETVNSHTFFLHDGRARNIEEAILWHGGEAENSKNKYKALKKEDRKAILSFLNSL